MVITAGFVISAADAAFGIAAKIIADVVIKIKDFFKLILHPSGYRGCIQRHRTLPLNNTSIFHKREYKKSACPLFCSSSAFFSILMREANCRRVGEK